MNRWWKWVTPLAYGLSILLPATAGAMPKQNRPIVIGHRGASGYRPEHTLASYALAIQLGADFIEPDLVSTKDHVLVARHENEISGTTDVASHPEFANRKATKTVDGVTLTGWFTEDFTLAELKTLRAVERLPQLRPRNTAYNGKFPVPTFQEIINLAQSASFFYHRQIGIYPETKHPTYFRGIGLPLEELLVSTLHRNGYRGKNAPVFIQSFEVGNLKRLSKMTRLPLIQLLDDAPVKPYDFVKNGDPRTYGDMMTRKGLAEIATYADGIGPWKNSIVPWDANNNPLPPTSLVRDAHRAGLLVHPYTFRRENFFLPNGLQVGDPNDPNFPLKPGNLAAEIAYFYRLGVDGLFTDNADIGVRVRDALFPPRRKHGGWGW